MSSDERLEFFLDRSLGKRTAQQLRAAGHTVHLIADFYPNDAQTTPDDEWIAEGCRRGWVLLTKDKRIRYRADQLGALDGFLFCVAGGNLTLDVLSDRLLTSIPRIERAVARHDTGFFHVYAGGTIRRMWP